MLMTVSSIRRLCELAQREGWPRHALPPLHGFGAEGTLQIKLVKHAGIGIAVLASPYDAINGACVHDASHFSLIWRDPVLSLG